MAKIVVFVGLLGTIGRFDGDTIWFTTSGGDIICIPRDDFKVLREIIEQCSATDADRAVGNAEAELGQRERRDKAVNQILNALNSDWRLEHAEIELPAIVWESLHELDDMKP